MDVRRRATALLVGLVLATLEVAAPAPPVAAAATDSDTLVFISYRAATWDLVRNGARTSASAAPVYQDLLAGDFSAAPGTDLFVYNAGGPSGIVHVEPAGTGATSTFAPKTVRGDYRPVAGDFDGDGVDDVLWYGYGATADSIWLFRPDGSHRSVPITVSGAYIPFAVETSGDGRDDVFWYGYGAAPDHLWTFGPGASHTSRPMRVTGQYRPIVGHFRDTPAGTSQEQVLWHSWDGPSNLWTFTDEGHTFRGLPGPRNRYPVVGDLLGTGRDVVFWYGPGGYQSEHLTTVAADGTPTLRPSAQVNGVYEPVVGDLDGNGREDIAWTADGGATIWTLTGDGQTYGQTRVEPTDDSSWLAPAVARTDPADL